MELQNLAEHMPLPPPLAERLESLPLIGVNITLSEDIDASGLGVDLQWMTPAQMVSEATEVMPGILAVKLGYTPVGICIEGSGDPYFYRGMDGAIVRIPHIAAIGGLLDERQIEVVATSIDSFLESAEIAHS